jgi:RimJ/RimL family protein N-acetyltransferase
MRHSEKKPFIFGPADRAAIRQFVGWQYEPPYDVYNLDLHETEELLRYFLQPDVNCYVITDKDGDLLAYCTFGPDGQVPGGDYHDTALDIGLGVRPDLTGQGQGHTFVNAVLDFARRTFAPVLFRVTIAEFNQRAQRVWMKAGFDLVSRFGRTADGMPFVIFVREP